MLRRLNCKVPRWLLRQLQYTPADSSRSSLHSPSRLRVPVLAQACGLKAAALGCADHKPPSPYSPNANTSNKCHPITASTIFHLPCLWLHELVPAQAFGLKASALGRPNDKVPPWLLKWAALVLGFVQQERQLLPAQLLALRLPLVHYTPLTAAAEAKGVGWLRTKPAGTASRPQPRALRNLILHCGSVSAAGARRPVTAAAEARHAGSVRFGGIDVLDAAAAPCMLLLRSPCYVLATQVGVPHRPRASQSRSRRSQPSPSACRQRETLPQAYHHVITYMSVKRMLQLG